MVALDSGLVAALGRLDSCTVSNVVETFDARLRNEGFTDGSLHCLFPALPPVVGHAVTARVRTSTPPPVGHLYYDRTDWWTYILSVPPPRIVIAQDVDDRPGFGAFIGEVHASILRALGCVAFATNGAVRDLVAVEQLGFQLFAGAIVSSHAFAHIVDFGSEVEIGGLRLASGDIVHGDRHGLVTIPEPVATEVPRVAAEMMARDRAVTEFCRSSRFSIEELRSLIRHLG